MIKLYDLFHCLCSVFEDLLVYHMKISDILSFLGNARDQFCIGACPN